MKEIKLRQMVPKVPVINWRDCPAKSYKDASGVKHMGIKVRTHSVQTACVAEALTRKMLHKDFRRSLPPDYLIRIALHDVGKISPGFVVNRLQEQDVVGWCKDHTEIGEAALKSIFPHADVRLGKMCGAHHGAYHPNEAMDACDGCYGGQEWQEQRRLFAEEMIGVFGPLQGGRISKRSELLLMHLTSLADHIASEFFPPDKEMSDEDIRMEANTIVKNLGFIPFKFKDDLQFTDMFPFEPNDIQKACKKHIKKRGTYILEAGTGGGKSEAAWAGCYYASQKVSITGIFNSLPTRFTSNQMYKRFLSWLEKVCSVGSNPKLIHGQSANVMPHQSDVLSPNGKWFHTNRKAMIEPFGIGTVDQALIGVLNVRYNYIRLAALFHKFVVIDEAHAYGVYTDILLVGLLRELEQLGCITLLLSATLDKSSKAKLLGVKEGDLAPRGSYPMLTCKYGGKVKEIRLRPATSKNVTIRYMDRSAKIYKEAVRLASKGVNILWIENTVPDSQMSYLACEQAAGKENLPIGLIHAKFLPPRRLALEEEWVGMMGPGSKIRPMGCILFATQVAEQSLDIDFDLAILAIAPSDFIIQRIGRSRRQDGLRRPDCMPDGEAWILGPDPYSIKDEVTAREVFGSAALVYGLFPVWRSAKIWSKIGVAKLPQQTRSILYQTYKRISPKEPKWVTAVRDKLLAHIKNLELKAKLAMSSHTATVCDDEEAVFGEGETPMTRREEVPTQTVVVCRSIKVLNGLLRLELYYGESVDVPFGDFHIENMAKRRDVCMKIARNSMKLIVTKGLQECDETTGALQNVAFGMPIAVRITRSGTLLRADGRHTGYEYSEKLGAEKIV